MWILAVISRFLKDETGSYAILGTLTMPVFLAMGVGGVELYGVYNARQDLQYIADSASYSAVNNADHQAPRSGAVSYVNSITGDAEWKKEHPTLKNIRPTAYWDSRKSQIVVHIYATKQTPFLKLINIPSMSVSVKSTARGQCKPYKARYLGNAHINGNNEYVLTLEKREQRGWVWINNRFDLSQRQDIKLRLYFGRIDYRPEGGDGMTFTIQNDKQGHSAQGEIGESLGVAWHPAYPQRRNEYHIVAPALVVEFDTYKNAFDPWQDHTSVFLIGNKRHQYNDNNAYLDHRRPNEVGNYVTLPNIENGRYHFARFIWDPSRKKLIYYFDGKKIKDVSLDLLDFFGGSNVILGFSASTGGAINTQKACFFQTTILD